MYKALTLWLVILIKVQDIVIMINLDWSLIEEMDYLIVLLQLESTS